LNFGARKDICSLLFSFSISWGEGKTLPRREAAHLGTAISSRFLRRMFFLGEGPGLPGKVNPPLFS
jgi:hypothetical protein